MSERAAVRAGSPRRRLLVAAAVGALVLGALVGCRNEAGTAAYVGGTRITYDQVNAVAAGMPGPDKARQLECDPPIANLTFIEVVKDYAAANRLTLPVVSATDLTSAATAFGAPPDEAQTSPFVKTCATAIEYNNFLSTKVAAVTPTDTELQPGYQSAVDAGIVPAGQFDSYKQQLLQVTGVGQAFGVSRALATTAAKAGVEVNPRFAPSCTVAPCTPLSFTILRLQTQGGASFRAVTLPLTGSATKPAVVDTPTPAPPIAPVQQVAP